MRSLACVHALVVLSLSQAAVPAQAASATLSLSPDEGYVTRFVVGGRQPNSLTALLNNGTYGALASRGAANGAAGVVVRIVSHNKDPEMGGRVKVK